MTLIDVLSILPKSSDLLVRMNSGFQTGDRFVRDTLGNHKVSCWCSVAECDNYAREAFVSSLEAVPMNCERVQYVVYLTAESNERSEAFADRCYEYVADCMKS